MRPESAVVLRYGTAILLVGVALGIALFLRHDNLPHPFISFSLSTLKYIEHHTHTTPGRVDIEASVAWASVAQVACCIVFLGFITLVGTFVLLFLGYP